MQLPQLVHQQPRKLRLDKVCMLWDLNFSLYSRVVYDTFRKLGKKCNQSDIKQCCNNWQDEMQAILQNRLCWDWTIDYLTPQSCQWKQVEKTSPLSSRRNIPSRPPPRKGHSENKRRVSVFSEVQCPATKTPRNPTIESNSTNNELNP